MSFVVIASANGRVGIDVAYAVLARGGSALDAVEAGTRLVEDNPADNSVGYGGYPNLLGDVELDASIMDGTALRAGAVGALQGYRAAITVARRVMEDLPHVMLVGAGAARFAAEIGLVAENLLTPEAAATWRVGVSAGDLPADLADTAALASTLLARARGLVRDPEHVTGTVNFIARDAAGRIASAVSTSGWAWKYPGRLGDSPIIGAGNYADDRYGAAACTGWGEAAIRAGTARTIVASLRAGQPLADACAAAFADLDPILRGTGNSMSLIALDRTGGHTAYSSSPDRTYVFREAGMDQFGERPRICISADTTP